MTIIKKILDPLPNEHIVTVSPPPEEQQRQGRRRLNLFTGRSLSHRNLQLEQNYRGTHLALLGQQRSPGVIAGLEAAIATRPIPIDPDPDNPLNDQLVIEQGSGLSRQGEEIRLAAQQTVRIGDLPVYAPPEVLSGADTDLGDGNSPLEPRRLGDSLQTLVEQSITLPPAGIVLLQPIVTESSGAEPSNDPCPVDVAGLAFANRQLVDGTRLIFYAWPTEWLALPPPVADSTNEAEVNRWRSNLAYGIFRRELREPMPWGDLGIPIALLGFDNNWQVLFSDRYAVTRQGGRALHRPIPVPNSGNPFLWQARIEQFAEQLGELDLSQISPEDLADYFAWLPPVGGLPNYLVENLALPADASVVPSIRRQLFFPTGYRVEAAPIPEEQLDLVFRESASLLPYDTVSNDASSQVKLLVPVPQSLYDPDLLKFETIDPDFNATLTRFINQRAEVLHRRQWVRDRASLLHQAISGEPLKFPNPDPDQLEADEKAEPDPPFASLSAHQSAIAQGLHEQGFTVPVGAETLTVEAGDRLITYVYLDPNNPPAELMLTFQVGDDSDHRAYWGGLTSLIDRGILGTASRRRIDARPDLGEWIRLEVSLSDVGLNPGNVLTGMLFTLYNGRAAWGHTARVSADGNEQVWVDTTIPDGASELDTNEPWLWLTAAERLTPFEERYAIEEQDGQPIVTPLEALKTALENTPIDRYTLRLTSEDETERDQLATLLGLIPAASPVKATPESLLLQIQGVLSESQRDALLDLPPSNVPTPVADIFRTAIEEIFEQSQDNDILTILEIGETSSPNQGVEAFIETLERQINQAEDQIEFGFLQVRTDMFRIRQFVLGNEEANRLSVSPTLGEIAKRDTAAAAQKDLSDFFNQIKTEPPTGDAEPVIRAATPTLRDRSRNASTFEAVVRPVPISSGVDTTAFIRPTVISTFQPQVGVIGGPLVFTPSPQISGGVFRTTTPQRAAIQSVEKQTKPTAALFERPPDVILQQSPLVGKINQTIVIAERLQVRPAPEARNYAIADRASVVNNLAKANLFKDIPIPGSTNATFGQLKLRPDLNIDPDAIDDDADEVEFFSSSVRILDDTVAALRLAEGRIASYRQAIARSRQTLEELQSLRQQAQSRLTVIGGDLAEARHDVSVTRGLIAEEQERLNTINQKRQQILETQVKFLVYHRPRTLGPDTDTPVRPLLPSIRFPARPACLNQPWPLPDALQEATELLRQSPVSWFTHIPRLLHWLDRPEILLGAIQQATIRPPVAVFTPALQRFANQTSIFAQAITRTVTAQQQSVNRYRLATPQLDLNELSVASWQRLRDRAKEVLTLGDLIDGKHPSSTLSRSAANEFEDLTRALGCLYAGFSDIRPIFRLAWAERLSQYDSPINLRNLSSLPRWAEIDELERRELQSVADWLYLRVSAQQPEAIALINDLVRICILIASAAPVDQIIAGLIVEPTSVSKGGRVSIAIDPNRVRIGMKVLLYGANNRVIAEGNVDDLTASRAAARITKSTAATVQLVENTQVRFLRADDPMPLEVTEPVEDRPADSLDLTSTLAPPSVLSRFSSSLGSTTFLR